MGFSRVINGQIAAASGCLLLTHVNILCKEGALSVVLSSMTFHFICESVSFKWKWNGQCLNALLILEIFRFQDKDDYE